MYVSPHGNNQYTLLPYKVARTPCCNFFESYYWITIQKEIERTSDVPKKKADERLCSSYKKVEFLQF